CAQHIADDKRHISLPPFAVCGRPASHRFRHLPGTAHDDACSTSSDGAHPCVGHHFQPVFHTAPHTGQVQRALLHARLTRYSLSVPPSDIRLRLADLCNIRRTVHFRHSNTAVPEV